MKKAMLAMMLLATGSVFAAPRISIGVGFGVPARAAVVRPACPGPGYTWVDGYWSNGAWIAGYWAAPAPVVRYDNDRFEGARYDRNRGDHDRSNARVNEQHFDRDAHGDRR